MGRHRLNDESKRRIDTKVTIRCDLKEQGKKLNLNFSKLLEEALLKEIGKNKGE